MQFRLFGDGLTSWVELCGVDADRCMEIRSSKNALPPRGLNGNVRYQKVYSGHYHLDAILI
jgi:hypothetical protein